MVFNDKKIYVILIPLKAKKAVMLLRIGFKTGMSFSSDS